MFDKGFLQWDISNNYGSFSDFIRGGIQEAICNFYAFLPHWSTSNDPTAAVTQPGFMPFLTQLRTLATAPNVGVDFQQEIIHPTHIKHTLHRFINKKAVILLR
eukprot:Gb_18672 [translate_table: standard]